MMQIELDVNEDFVCFIGWPKISRPMHVSRARWLAFWQHWTMRGVTLRSLAAADSMMKGIRHDKSFDY
jgi:hypothetical protein